MRKGVLSGIKLYLGRRRLGELLVSKGLITTSQLKSALALQKQTLKPLGQIFLESAVISKRDLQLLLWKQTALRTCATMVLGLAMVCGATGKKVRADDLQGGQVVLASTSEEFTKVSAYPALFGMGEKRSGNLKPFTKWTKVLSRFEGSMKSNPEIVKAMEKRLEAFRGQSIKDMADNVNDMMNERPYISDKRNWGQNDYWETPVEFMKRGGDCEDFAIAKYAALRTLGVPEERLRLLILQDTQKNIPHAVLIVYAEDNTYVLDNQNKRMLSTDNISHYRPIYSINRQAWWLHSADKTMVASR